jgi:hypothetical protein
MIIHGCYRSLNAKWLQSIKDLLGDRGSTRMPPNETHPLLVLSLKPPQT